MLQYVVIYHVCSSSLLTVFHLQTCYIFACIYFLIFMHSQPFLQSTEGIELFINSSYIICFVSKVNPFRPLFLGKILLLPFENASRNFAGFMFISLFHMKVTTNVRKSFHQVCSPCYLHLPIFFLIHTLPSSAGKQKVVVISFPQQIRPKATVQWSILRDYSGVRIGFNMISKCHILPILCTMLVKIC